MRISPSNRNKPAMHLMAVDFPAPFGPGHDGDLARFHLKAQMIVGQHFSIGFCQFGYRQHGGIPLSGPHPGRLYYSIPRPRL